MLQTCKSTPPIQAHHGYLPEPDFLYIKMFYNIKEFPFHGMLKFFSYSQEWPYLYNICLYTIFMK